MEQAYIDPASSRRSTAAAALPGWQTHSMYQMHHVSASMQDSTQVPQSVLERTPFMMRTLSGIQGDGNDDDIAAFLTGATPSLQAAPHLPHVGRVL